MGFCNFWHGPVCKKLSHWSAAPTCMAASGALNMSCVVPSFLQSIFVCHWQNVDKININYLFILPCVFLACYRLYITVPIFLYFCFLSAQLRINFGQISVYHTLCLPCILHVHYWAYCWLCQFLVLDSCKRPTQDGLFRLVSYWVPLALRQSILRPTLYSS